MTLCSAQCAPKYHFQCYACKVQTDNWASQLLLSHNHSTPYIGGLGYRRTKYSWRFSKQFGERVGILLPWSIFCNNWKSSRWRFQGFFQAEEKEGGRLDADNERLPGHPVDEATRWIYLMEGLLDRLCYLEIYGTMRWIILVKFAIL